MLLWVIYVPGLLPECFGTTGFSLDRASHDFVFSLFNCTLFIICIIATAAAAYVGGIAKFLCIITMLVWGSGFFTLMLILSPDLRF